MHTTDLAFCWNFLPTQKINHKTTRHRNSQVLCTRTRTECTVPFLPFCTESTIFCDIWILQVFQMLAVLLFRSSSLPMAYLPMVFELVLTETLQFQQYTSSSCVVKYFHLCARLFTSRKPVNSACFMCLQQTSRAFSWIEMDSGISWSIWKLQLQNCRL